MRGRELWAVDDLFFFFGSFGLPHDFYSFSRYPLEDLHNTAFDSGHDRY